MAGALVLLAAALGLGVSALERRAAAQEEQVKPYVMLLFDTSGSIIRISAAPTTTATR